jgi:hypothetical protein
MADLTPICIPIIYGSDPETLVAYDARKHDLHERIIKSIGELPRIPTNEHQIQTSKMVNKFVNLMGFNSHFGIFLDFEKLKTDYDIDETKVIKGMIEFSQRIITNELGNEIKITPTMIGFLLKDDNYYLTIIGSQREILDENIVLYIPAFPVGEDRMNPQHLADSPLFKISFTIISLISKFNDTHVVDIF